jgi:hypothetical protein
VSNTIFIRCMVLWFIVHINNYCAFIDLQIFNSKIKVTIKFVRKENKVNEIIQMNSSTCEALVNNMPKINHF